MSIFVKVFKKVLKIVIILLQAELHLFYGVWDVPHFVSWNIADIGLLYTFPFKHPHNLDKNVMMVNPLIIVAKVI